MKVALLIGTRPEAIKIIPLYQELKSRKELEVVLISTGQHAEMLKQIFTFFDILPDYELQVMSANQTLSGLTSILFRELDTCLNTINPDMVVVQGDTTTAFVGAMTGFYQKRKVAHIEAGLRTYDKSNPFPEETNRQLISRLADYHFTPTEKATQALQEEKCEEVIETGNTVIDALLKGLEIVEANQVNYKSKYQQYIDPAKKTVLVTGHRRESFGSGFENICTALKHIALAHPEVNIIYPVHLNPNVKEIVNERLSGIKNIYLIAPVDYGDIIYLMSQSYIILTDSGGIQEEAPTLGKPLIVMRNTTERPEGIDAGCAVLAGTSSEKIIAYFEEIYTSPVLYDKMSKTQNPYGDGQASKRIADKIQEINTQTTA